MSTIKCDNITWKTGEATANSQYTITTDKIVWGTAKSWLKYNGSTPAVLGSFNISSVSRTATGQNTINFTNALADTNYCPTYGKTPELLLAVNPWPHILDFVTFATSSITIQTGMNTSGSSSYTDFPGVFVAISR
jgi:hypothetical protein